MDGSNLNPANGKKEFPKAKDIFKATKESHSEEKTLEMLITAEDLMTIKQKRPKLHEDNKDEFVFL